MSELDKAPLLKEKIEVLSGFAFPSSGFNQLDGLPLIRIRDLGGITTEVRFRGVYDPAYLVSKGDLLVGMDGDFEVHRWEGEDALLNQRVCKISSASKEIHQSFLYWYLKPKIAEIHRRTPQTTVRHLSTKDIYAIDEPPVGFPAQELIAQILNTLDTAIRETEALIDKLKAVKQGLLHDLLTRGIDTNGQLRPPQSDEPQLYKESPLGWMPREWEVAVIGSKVHVIDPNPSHRYPLDQEDGVPICSTENFEGEDDFDLSRSKRMPNSVFLSQKSRCGFSADDVVFARKGRIGLARRYGEDQKVFSHTIVTLTPKTEDVDRKWLLWLARSEVFLGGISIRMNSNSGVPTLGIELINSVLTPFPSRHEQAQISQVLDDAAERLRIEQEQLVAQRQMKAGLMDDLLTGRVRVTPLLKSAQQTAAPIVQQPVGQTGD